MTKYWVDIFYTELWRPTDKPIDSRSFDNETRAADYVSDFNGKEIKSPSMSYQQAVYQGPRNQGF